MQVAGSKDPPETVLGPFPCIWMSGLLYNVWGVCPIWWMGGGETVVGWVNISTWSRSHRWCGWKYSRRRWVYSFIFVIKEAIVITLNLNIFIHSTISYLLLNTSIVSGQVDVESWDAISGVSWLRGLMWSRTEGWADASAAVAVVLERTVEDRDPAADVGGWFCFCSAQK